MHENRETSVAPAQAGRSGKANNHKPDANAREESDCVVVPMKQPNKDAAAAAEDVEERTQIKENAADSTRARHRAGHECPTG